MSLRSWLGRTIGLTDAGFWSSYFAVRNSAQKPVSEDTVMTVSAAWACIRLLRNSTAILPYNVYRKLPNGGAEILTGHPAYSLLHDQPNADTTADDLWGAVTTCLAGHGNAFGLKQKLGDRIVAVELIDPRVVMVTRYPQTFQKRYRFAWRDRSYDLTDDDVIHWKGFNFGGDEGLSAIRYGANTLGIAMAGDDTAGKMFANGAHQSGFIQSPVVMKKDQRDQFQKSLQEFRASDSAGKLMLLEGGFTYSQMGVNFDDMQMLQSRAFSVEEVCRFFSIPPFMVGHTEKVTSWGSGLEQQLIGYLTFALLPYLKIIEKRNNLAFLTAPERAAGLYTEFNVEGILRADSAARAALYSVMAQNGVMTRNEMRGKENLPSKPGGDTLTVQSNLVPLDMLGEVAARAAKPPPAPADTPPAP